MLPSSWLFHVDIITAWLLVHHPHGSDPWGRNTCTWATSWRHPDPHQQTSVHLLMHAPRYSVKGGNIPPERRYSLIDQISMAASPVFGEAPPRLAEKGKKLTFLLHWFQQCSSFETIHKIFILHMGVMPDGRLCIRGMQGRAHTFIVIKSTMTPASGSRIFCKIYGPLDFSTFSNQAVSVNDPVS